MSLPDYDRPLAKRGRKAAPLIGAEIARLGLRPDLILCSGAARTRETLDLVLPALGAPPPEIVYDDAIYMATPTALLGLLRKLPAGGSAPKTVLVVGHNPGLEELSELLVGGGNDGRAGADGGEISDRRPRRLYLRQRHVERHRPRRRHAGAFHHAGAPDLTRRDALPTPSHEHRGGRGETHRAMLILIDNYDSFTYNLVHYLGELGAPCEVIRNDKISAEEVLQKKPQAIVLSPGPCTPNEAGICLDLIAKAGGKVPLLGVCLGHQAIGQVYGGKVIRAPEPLHGKLSSIRHTERGRLQGPAFDVRRHPLPLADRRARQPAGRPRGDGRDARRPHHGPAAQDACRCTACSSIPRASPRSRGMRCSPTSLPSPA